MLSRKQQRLGENTAHLLEAVLDRVFVATIVLTADGTVLYSNEAARRLLQAGDGLRLDGEGRLHALSREATDRLLASVARVAGERVSREGWACVRLARPSERAELELMIEPLGHGNFSPEPERLAVAFVHCPEERFEVDSDIFARVYGLSPKEAQVATLLLQGVGLAEIARSMDVSINTVRTHLRGVFTKTGTNRQAELACKLFRGVVGTALAGWNAPTQVSGVDTAGASASGPRQDALTGRTGFRTTGNAQISSLTPLPGPFPRGGSGLFGALPR